MKKITSIVALMLAMLLPGCSADTPDFEEPKEEPTETPVEEVVTVPTVQSASTAVSLDEVAKKGLGGIRLNFQMSGITEVVLESVDGYQIAGTLNSDKQSIITFNAPEGGLTPNTDYYIVTFPCDLSGGYRLSIYKDGQVASYFGVHQTVEAGSFISPTDLVESELIFDDPDAPFVEDERPSLNQATKDALVAYQHNPTDENKAALMEQMGIRYDKVVARKKAKLRELEREALHQTLLTRCKPLSTRWSRTAKSAWNSNSID